jgi:hypothetical protein
MHVAVAIHFRDVAPLVTFEGPAERARTILLCVDSFASIEYSEECICAMPAWYNPALVMITTAVAISVWRFPVVIRALL